MKVNDIKKELNKLSSKELHDAAETFRKQLFGLRINAATAHVKDYSQFRKLRKHVARALTLAQQKKSSI